MSDNQKGEVVDFTDAPQSSTFGRNADGGFINDPGQNAIDKAKANIPFYAQWNSAMDSAGTIGNAFDGGEAPEPYFHGEWWEQLLLTIREVAKIGVQIVDAFDYGKGVVNAFTGNILDTLGSAAAAVCKGFLDWLWASVQPVQDAAGILLGNPGKIENSAAMWKSVAENLNSVGEAVSGELTVTLNEAWKGRAGAGATVRGGDLVETVAFASQSATGLSELLYVYGDMAEKINDMVRQMIADLVSTLVSAAGDIATKGPLAIIPIGIDLAILLARYTLRLIGIATQEVWFIIAGVQMVNSIQDSFEKAMSVLEKLSGYNNTVTV